MIWNCFPHYYTESSHVAIRCRTSTLEVNAKFSDSFMQYLFVTFIYEVIISERKVEKLSFN